MARPRLLPQVRDRAPGQGRIDQHVDSDGVALTEQIGKEYAAHTTRRGRSLDPEERPQIFLGWLCTFVYAVAFLFVYANILRFLWPDRGPRKRRMPKRYEPPTT